MRERKPRTATIRLAVSQAAQELFFRENPLSYLDFAVPPC